LQGKSLGDMAPDLVAKHWRRDHTVASAMMGGAWIAHITGPRTIPMMVQYVLVREALEGVELTHGRPDSLIWWWSSTRVYSASSAFNTMCQGAMEETKAPGKMSVLLGGLFCTTLVGYPIGYGAMACGMITHALSVTKRTRNLISPFFQQS
jgi:hypothetical protein